MMSKAAGRFTPTHHALLFAWMARAVIVRVGEEQGEAVMRKAVRRYGEERGHRMALRAQADGAQRSMAYYLAYGEWSADPEESEQAIARQGADVRMTVHRCPWHAAWAENDMMVVGRLYCLEIDEALVRGFNAALRLDVARTRPNDGESCEFVFREVEKRVPRRGRVMPWAYHVGHLYKTVGQAILEAIGPAGREAVHEALETFAQRYGEEAAAVILSYQDMDFGQLPD